MKKWTKILFIMFILVTIPAIVLGRFVIKGIVPTEKGFTFNFGVEAIIGLVLTAISIILGIILFIKFIKSLPIDKAIFFSTLPLVIIYGLSLFLIAQLSLYKSSTAKSFQMLLNISSDNIYNTVLWSILISLIFISLLFFNYFILCKPLTRVEKIVSRLSDGKVKDEKLKIGGGKQFNSIEHSLNKINNNYRSKDNSLRSVNLETQKFIPKQFFKLLGKSSVQELELGNQVKKIATIMMVRLVGLDSHENLTLEESFNFINAYMHIISPLIRRFGGFIDKYDGNGITAAFARSEDAIDCSHAIIRSIQIKNRQNRTLPNVEPRISIMTHEVIFGIVGEEERKMPTIISNIDKVLAKLDDICKIMYAKIVFTKSTLDSLPLNYKFRYRHLGKITQADNNEIIIFEDFEVKRKDISSMLVKSKEHFEYGILLYNEGKYKEALERFSDALKICPNDKGCYLYYNKTKEKI